MVSYVLYKTIMGFFFMDRYNARASIVSAFSKLEFLSFRLKKSFYTLNEITLLETYN